MNWRKLSTSSVRAVQILVLMALDWFHPAALIGVRGPKPPVLRTEDDMYQRRRVVWDGGQAGD